MKGLRIFFMAGLLAFIVGCGTQKSQNPTQVQDQAVLVHIGDSGLRAQTVDNSQLPVAQPGYVAAVGINATQQSDGTVIAELATATAGALIRYTTDGSQPTWSSPWYSQPLRLNKSSTLKAFALLQGLGNSPVRSFTFESVIPQPISTSPTTSVLEPLPAEAGRVGAVGATLLRTSSSVQVSLKTLTAGALIRYTTDGSDPDWRSPWYTDGQPLNLTPSTPLKTIAMLAGLGNSPIRSIPLGSTSTPLPQPNPSPTNPSSRTLTYTASDEIFPNPERGFRRGVQLMGFGGFANERAMGHTLLQAYVRLQDYKNGPIPDGFLNQLRGQLEAVRTYGLKVTLRFWYSWSESETDAPKWVVLQHIRQLTPVLRDYSDVILALQGGFIGAWGEWHSSLAGLDNPADKKDIFNLLTQALPGRRVQVRTVADMRLIAPMGSEASVAQLGHHNDCFMVNQSDAGTYAWDGAARDDDRAYLQRLSANGVPVTGEMCGDVPESGYDPYNRRTPEGQLAELERFHWTSIADDFGPIDRWRTWGILDTINRRLGYRYRLTSVSVPAQVVFGGRLTASINLQNDGFAAITNSRPVRLVLREHNSRAEFPFTLSTDPRQWKTGSSQVNLDAQLPTSLVRGSYDLFLSMPDESPRLSTRPEYAVRLANPNVWEVNTGYNSLNASVQVQ